MIELSEIQYSYPQSLRPSLDAASLSVERGELVVVAGSSGSGKSTLLRCINGLVPHFHGGTFSGIARVFGISTIATRPRQLAEHVGFLGQDPEQHAVVDRVEDDIAFTLENLGTAQATMRRRIDESLDALGIAQLRHRRLDTLSGGERQKAAIASVLAAMPSFLVLDEPASQLDPRSAEEVTSAILGLRDELGLGVVVAEHRLDRLLQYADILCLVEEGRTASGDPADMLLETTLGPPVVQLGRGLGWSPLPLDLKEARRRAAGLNPTIRPRRDPEATGDVIVAARGVGVSYGKTRVLKDVSLEARQGEVLAVMGRNGSGKTTLLRALAGLQRIDGGQVASVAPSALVPQDPSRILFGPTVAAELELSLKGRGKPADPRSVAREAAHSGVEGWLDLNPLDLSGGQRTKVAIAVATAGAPALVMLDEPTRGMDEDSKSHLRDMVRDWAATGRAFLIATHDVELAASVATRVIILSDGAITVDASPREALSGSLTFSTQMNKVFNEPRILTVADALEAIR